MKLVGGGCIGCLLVGGVLVLAFVVIAVTATSNRPPRALDHITLAHAVKSKKHGWVTTKSEVDLWARPSALCAGIEAGADELISAQREGREPDTTIGDRVPGHATLRNGVRVQVIGHSTAQCVPSGHGIPLTHVRVDDVDSTQNGRAGYLVEGLLSKQ